MQFGQSALLLDKTPQFLLKGVPEEAVDEWVKAAVGKGCQPHSMTCQGIVLPQCVAFGCVSLQEVNTDERVLREPAEEED